MLFGLDDGGVLSPLLETQDIVIPGCFIAAMRCFDAHRGPRGSPTYHNTLCAYVLAVIASAVQTSEAPKPTLLYVVPACLCAALATAAALGELGSLARFLLWGRDQGAGPTEQAFVVILWRPQ